MKYTWHKQPIDEHFEVVFSERIPTVELPEGAIIFMGGHEDIWETELPKKDGSVSVKKTGSAAYLYYLMPAKD